MKHGKILIVVLVLIFVLSLAACGTGAKVELKDGKYEAESEVRDEQGGYGIVAIEVKDGDIVDVVYNTYSKDGTIKDENYQIKLKDENPALYKLAQESVAANPEYAAQLLKYKRVEDIDVISGATWNYDIFKDAAEKALNLAKK